MTDRPKEGCDHKFKLASSEVKNQWLNHVSYKYTCTKCSGSGFLHNYIDGTVARISLGEKDIIGYLG